MADQSSERRRTDDLIPPGTWSTGNLLHHIREMLDEREKKVDAIFQEHRYQQTTAEQEREKAAQQLRAAMVVAEEEREKAAAQVRDAMETQIREGDANLERHIDAQITSVAAALRAVERLGEEKDKRIEDAFEAAQTAITKATESQDKRLNLLNEFRQQSSDRDRLFPSREVVDQQFQQLDERLKQLEADRYQRLGERSNQTETKEQNAVTIGQVLALVAIVVTIAAILVGAYT